MTDVQVRSEPLTYDEFGPHSFFRDAAVARALRDENAEARLERHEAEMAVEKRAANTTAGTGGEFTVPLWLESKFKLASRAGRPLADQIPNLPLPRGVYQVNVPKFGGPTILGGSTLIQPGQNEAEAGLDATSSQLQSPVVTLAGEQMVAQQLFDLSPVPSGFDAAVYLDLTNDYNVQLEGQLLYGSGTNGQLTGINVYTIPTANTISGAGITTIANFWPALGQAFAAIGNGRGLAPEFWIMAPRRWAWIASSVDSSNRPIASPGGGRFHDGQDVPLGGGNHIPFGPIDGLPVFVDGAIPAGTTADTVFCVRASDMLLFESDAKLLTTPQPGSGTLTVKLSLHRYAAFIGNPYTAAIAKVSALPQPANF